MEYTETGSGGLIWMGRSVVSTRHLFLVEYGVGDIVYNKHAAMKGVMEKIVVKDVIPTKQRMTAYRYVVLFKDTLNGLWNEGDLVPYDVAKQYAEEYLDALLASYEIADDELIS